MGLIREIVLRWYGNSRVREELCRVYGKRVGRKKVARMMRENGLNTRLKRSFVRTTRSDHGLPVCENLLNKDFHALGAGAKWVSDITYLRTSGDWVYLTVVIDLWDGKVVDWAMSADMETEHIADVAVDMACKNRTPQEGLVFHSDRGVQYCARSFRSHLWKRCPAVLQSMSWNGNYWDNACAESFFKTLKRELETLDSRHSEAEVRQSMFIYIEAYYNRVRMPG